MTENSSLEIDSDIVSGWEDAQYFVQVNLPMRMAPDFQQLLKNNSTVELGRVCFDKANTTELVSQTELFCDY